MSASWNWIAWKLAIGLPNCSRSCAYLKARSYAPCASPTPIAATEIRPPSRISRNCWNPLPRVAEQVPLGHARVLERQLARVGGAPAELLHRLGDLVAGRAVRDDQVRDLVVAGERRDRHAGRDVRARVRDEDLRAVDDPLAVLQLGPRARGRGVGARRPARSARTRRASCPTRDPAATRASAPRSRRGRSASSRATCAPRP